VKYRTPDCFVKIESLAHIRQNKDKNHVFNGKTRKIRNFIKSTTTIGTLSPYSYKTIKESEYPNSKAK